MAKSHYNLKFGQSAVRRASLVFLLLLIENLAYKVFISIENGNIKTEVPYDLQGPQTAIIEDNKGGELKCVIGQFSCFFSCNSSKDFSTMHGVNGSVLFNTTLKPLQNRAEYLMNQSTACQLYPCKEETIKPLLDFLYSNHSYEEELMQLSAMRASCPQLFSSSQNAKSTFLKVEKQIIYNIMDTSQFKTGPSRTYSLKTLSLNVVNVSEMRLSDLNSSSRIQLSVPQLLPQNSSFIPEVWLPVNALLDIPSKERIIGLVSYLWHTQFQFGQVTIASMVIRIEHLGQKRLQNLSTSIEMVFSTSPLANNSWFECHYLDENDWLWKTNGCETQNRTDGTDTKIICNCNHATSFAVLMMRDPISEEHWEILSLISYIGCSLSAFFTALSIVLYIFNRTSEVNYAASIHVSLSAALFLLNTAFLLTEWGATQKTDGLCVFIAALMHYSLLCCFTWMAIEALHLYLLLIKVFTTFFKHYLLKLSLAGWGIPVVIVAISLVVTNFRQLYGVTEITMANSNQTSAICWITNDTYFYSVNLAYFTIIFIFNSGILIAVACNICKMKPVLQSKSSPGAGAKGKSLRFSDSCRNSITVLGITCLLGTTWGLAFLGSGYVNYPILYLFCILNSTQGFFVFLWTCLSTRRQKRRIPMDSMSSSPVKTSVSQSD